MKVKYAFIVCIMCLVCFGEHGILAQDVPKLAEKALASTVYLETTDAQRKQVFYGNGFFVSPILLVTNLHVVAGAMKGTVKINGDDEKKYPVLGVVATDVENNLALLAITIPGVPVLPLDDSDKVRAGNRVYYVAGDRNGLKNEVSEGVIRRITLEQTKKRFQMKTPIIPRFSSGGPVLNTEGDVIGVTLIASAFMDRNGTWRGLYWLKDLNYIVPAEYIKDLLGARNTAIPLEAYNENISAKTYCTLGSALYNLGMHEGAIWFYNAAIKLKPDYVAAYIKQGDAWQGSGQGGIAGAQYKKALQLNPESAEVYNSLGKAIYRREQPSYARDAIPKYDTAIRLDPNLAAAYINRGWARIQRDDQVEAISDFDTAIRLNPKSAEAYCGRALAKARLYKYEDAITDYDSTIRLNPYYAEAYYERGKLKMYLGQYTAALKDFDSLIQISLDQYVDAYYYRGRSKLKLGQCDAAVSDYDTFMQLKSVDARYFYNIMWSTRRATKDGGDENVVGDFDVYIQLRPTDPMGYYYRGMLKINLGQYDATIADFDAAIRLKPNAYQFYRKRGSVKVKLAQYAAAVADYDAAIQFNSNPNTQWIDYYERGVAKMELGQKTAAISDFDKVIQLKSPYTKNAYYNRGKIKASLGKYAAAISDYDAALQYKPSHHDYRFDNNAKIYYSRASAKAALGQHAAAISDYDITIRLDPDYADVYFQRGKVKMFLGQYAAAVLDFDTFISLDSDNHAEAYYFRGRAKRELGQYAAAIADLDNAIHLKPNDVLFYLERCLLKAQFGKLSEAKQDFQTALEVAKQVNVELPNEYLIEIKKYISGLEKRDMK